MLDIQGATLQASRRGFRQIYITINEDGILQAILQAVKIQQWIPDVRWHLYVTYTCGHHSVILLTCNNREKEAVREAYNLLNEYKEKIVGPPTDSSAQDESDDSGQDSDGDIEAALEKEKADLNKERSKKPSEREFQVVDSGARNCIFIKTSLDCPEKLMEEIISDLEETKKLKSRYILRFVF